MESNKHPSQLLMRRNSDRTDKVFALFKSDRRLMIREMSKEVEIFISLCHATVSSDLGVRQVAVKLVPRVFIAEQKEKCLFAATELLQCTESDSGFLRHIITGEGTQIYGYDPETKAQSPVWKSPLSPQQDKCVAHSSTTPPPPPQIKKVVCIVSSHQQVKQQVRNIIYNLCSVSVTQYATSNQKSDCQGMGKFTKTLHQPHHRSFCNTS